MYSTVSYITMQMLMLKHDYHFHKVYVLDIESWSVLVMNVTPGFCYREAHQSFTLSPPTHTHTHFNKSLSFSIYIIYLWAVTSKVQIVF